MMIILKVTKTQGLILSLEDTFFKKPQEGGAQFDTPQPFSRLKLYLRIYLSSFLRTPREASDVLYGGVVLYGVFC